MSEQLLTAGFVASETNDALLRASLGDPRSRVVVLALRASARRQLLTDDDWLGALTHDDVDVRREALALYAKTSARDAVAPTVRALLADDDALVVEAAAFCAGEHGDDVALEALVRVATTHDDARCRESAVAALGAIGDERGLASILAALEDKPPVRRRAVVALSNFEGPDVDAALERAREDRDWQVRAAADQLR